MLPTTSVVDVVHIGTPRGGFQALAAGVETNPLVLVLHGFPDFPATFTSMIGALAERGFRVIAPWLRGYAPSPLSGPYHVDALAADAIAIADQVDPNRRVHLIGHDWGALVSYVACAVAPRRIASAVAMSVPHPRAFASNFLRSRQALRSWYVGLFQLPGASSLAAAREFALIDHLWRTWSPGFRLTDGLRNELHACLRASWPAPLLYYRAALRPTPGSAGLRRVARGARLDVPILYLHGADDGCIGPEVEGGAERHVAGPYRVEVIPNAGHFLAAEVPTIVARLASDWMAEFERGASAAAAG